MMRCVAKEVFDEGQGQQQQQQPESLPSGGTTGKRVYIHLRSQINQAKFGKRKYNRGRHRDGRWVLGGIERGTDSMFMAIVPNRQAATLLPIIQANVTQGSIIHTDEWRSYGGLNTLGYIHHTVNHTTNFVDPATGAYTQSIESSWAHAKSKYKRMHGTSCDLFPTYLIEYMWRRKHGKD